MTKTRLCVWKIVADNDTSKIEDIALHAFIDGKRLDDLIGELYLTLDPRDCDCFTCEGYNLTCGNYFQARPY